ncbi:MAG TPA: hypothetical protein VGO35_12935, partial [Gammaproteobacteria bacterium]|nr:hypothetical protein [Gammaproteobacteria bacterium]
SITAKDPSVLTSTLAGATSWAITSGDGGTVTNATHALTFAGFGTLNGGAGADSFVLSGGSLSGSINGGAGSNTLTGANLANIWTINGADSGNINGLTFNSIQNLLGGNANDTFTFVPSGSLTGTINGGVGGTNTLDYSAEGAAAVTVTMTGANTGTATATGGFTNINNLMGDDSGATANTTLTGDGTGDTFTIGAMNSGSLSYNSGGSTLTFVKVGNLTGGAGADAFNITAGGFVSNINGQATDTIDVQSAVNAAGLSLSYTAGIIESAAAGDILTANSLTLGGASSIKGLTTATGFLTAVPGLTIANSAGANATIVNTGALNLAVGSSAGANLTVTDDSAVNLGNIALGAGAFNLTATSGNITGGTLTAGNATLTAATGSIGSAVANLLTNLSGTLTATAGGSIWVNDSGALALGAISSAAGNNLTAASMTASSVTLTAAAGGNTLTTAGAMTLDDLTAVNGLTLVNAGTLTVNNSAGGATPGINLTAGSLTQSGAGGVVLNGGIQTAGGSVSIQSGVTVNGNIGVNSGNGSVAFASAVNGSGGSSLNVNTGSGNIHLAGVNLSAASGTLALTSSGTVTLNSDVNASTVNLTGVTSKLAIGGTLAITTSNTALDLTKIVGGIDDTAAGTHGLTINTGTGSVLLAPVTVGGFQALQSLTINAAQMNLGRVNTTSGESYTGNVQLNGNLTNTGGGSITLQGGTVVLSQSASVANTAGDIGIAGTVNGNLGLTLNAGGNVTLSGIVGGGTPLASLTVTGKSIITDAVTTSGNQTYNGSMTLKGDLTSVAGGIDFTNKLQLANSVTLTANQMGFGGTGSVSGTKTLTILPRTAGYTVDLGSGGTSSSQLMLTSDAFNGYQGKLYIGGVPGTVNDAASSLAGLPIAGSVLLDGDISLGTSGTLVIVSKGNLTLESGTISAGTVILGASDQLLSAPTGTNPATVEGNNIYTIAAQIGQNGTGQAIDVGNLPGGAPAQLFIGSKNSSVFFVEAPGTQENKDPNEQTLVDFAGALGISPLSGNVTVTNSGQQTAANQQTGGLLTSGFIDVSVFQQISLYDVSGSGIALPGDQCEEESSGPSTICGAGGQ